MKYWLENNLVKIDPNNDFDKIDIDLYGTIEIGSGQYHKGNAAVGSINGLGRFYTCANGRSFMFEGQMKFS